MSQSQQIKLEDYTTLHIGGPAQAFYHTQDRDEFIGRIQEADKTCTPLLILGGGSNILVSDQGFDGTVIKDGREELEIKSNEKSKTAQITVSAGYCWDDFVKWTIEHGLSGLSALSGIPGSVGGSPVQNIGAYGHEVSSVINSVIAYDRFEQKEVELHAQDLAFAYRSSAIKRSIAEAKDSDPVALGPSGRWIVLEVVFTLEKSLLSEPVKYAELARQLGTQQGARLESKEIRKHVLELRDKKGMRYNKEDRDCWSAGSFFTNPILSKEQEQALDSEAPRYKYLDGYKSSAAWLIDHAGFHKGFKLDDSGAQLSTKHVLALCNHKAARAQDVLKLAQHIQAGVFEKYQIALEMEAIKVGLD